MADDGIFVARETCTTDIDGEVYTVRRGVTRVRGSHPLVKLNPHLFEPVDAHYDIEQATAAPGEKRGRRRVVIDADAA